MEALLMGDLERSKTGYNDQIEIVLQTKDGVLELWVSKSDYVIAPIQVALGGGVQMWHSLMPLNPVTNISMTS